MECEGWGGAEGVCEGGHYFWVVLCSFVRLELMRLCIGGECTEDCDVLFAVDDA